MWTIDYNSVLGAGRWSTVYQATSSNKPGQLFACKLIKKDRLTEKDHKYATNESKLLVQLNHPHIVKCFDMVETPDAYQIYLECCPLGDIFEACIRDYPNGLRESLVHSIFRQLHGALVECHSHNIVHRDFKIENIFVRSFIPGTRDKIDIALGDFGLAAQFADGEKLAQWVGTPEYAAPEMYLQQPYTTEPDVWMLGVVIYCLYTSHFPFGKHDGTIADMAETITECEPRYHPSMPTDLRSMLDQIFIKKKENRATLTQLTQYSWYRKFEV